MYHSKWILILVLVFAAASESFAQQPQTNPVPSHKYQPFSRFQVQREALPRVYTSVSQNLTTQPTPNKRFRRRRS